MDRELGRVLVGVGIAAVVLGLLVQTGALRWFGNLPGDIRIETETGRVFIPITSMVVVSVVLSVLLTLWTRLR